MPHPNYVAVVAEGVALPLVHTGWIIAFAFSVLNAALMTTRIRVENAALGEPDMIDLLVAGGGPAGLATRSM